MSTAISDCAEKLRQTIERAKEANADIRWLSRFPMNCCNFCSNLLVLDLSEAGVGKLQRVIGTIDDDDDSRHVWVEAEGHTVDICADQHGQSSVIATQESDWHNSLEEIKPFVPQTDLPEGISVAEIARLRELYEQDLSELAPYR